MCFLRFKQKFKMAAKNGGKSDFWQKVADKSAYILQVKNFVEIALSHTVSKINAFLRFQKKFQDGRQQWRENNF